MRILFVYMYATFGGVERILLNRATALYEKYRSELIIDMLFLRDTGVFSSLKREFPPNWNIFLSSAFNKDLIKGYDMIFIIDTPSFYEFVADYKGVLIIECHTLYEHNRMKTFTNVPKNVSVFIVPSLYQKDLIASEYSEVLKEKYTFILPNFVADCFFDHLEVAMMPELVSRPVAFFHRLDDLKNYREAVDIFSRLFVQRKDIVFLISGKIDNSVDKTFGYLYENIKKNFFYLPKIDFARMPGVLKYIYYRKGVFLSTSKGESFGMTVAEAMSTGVPVLLSNIPSHRELVGNNEKYLYKLGDYVSGSLKLDALLSENEYGKLSSNMRRLSQKFRKDNFLLAWENLMRMLARGN